MFVFYTPLSMYYYRSLAVLVLTVTLMTATSVRRPALYGTLPVIQSDLLPLPSICFLAFFLLACPFSRDRCSIVPRIALHYWHVRLQKHTGR